MAVHRHLLWVSLSSTSRPLTKTRLRRPRSFTRRARAAGANTGLVQAVEGEGSASMAFGSSNFIVETLPLCALRCGLTRAMHLLHALAAEAVLFQRLDTTGKWYRGFLYAQVKDNART